MMKSKMAGFLALALLLTVIAGTHGLAPAQATELQPGVAEIEINTNTNSVLTGELDGQTNNGAFQPVEVWVDADSNGFYGNNGDYSLGSGMTDAAGDFSVDLNAGFQGIAGLQIGDGVPDNRPRLECWWVPTMGIYVCIYL